MLGDDDEVTIRNPPDARGEDEPEAVVLLRVHLAVAKEERRAKQEERQMKEEGGMYHTGACLGTRERQTNDSV